MIPAAVGFQCPEDVAEGARTQRQARTIGGGLVTANSGVVTRTILVILVAVFGLQLITGGPIDDPITRALALVPIKVAAGEWWRLITVVLVHGSVMHILFNGWALWVLGPELERYLGTWRYLTVFVLAGLGGGVASYCFSFPLIIGVGASGAVFGIFGGLIVLARRMRLNPQPLLVLLGINLVIGFIPSFNIDWRAHLGGLVTGGLLTAVMAYAPRTRNLAYVSAAVAAVLVVCVVAVAVRTDQLENDPDWQGWVAFEKQGGDVLSPE